MPIPPLTPLAQSLPASVPFVGPETQERQQNRPFIARLGANESVFGPSPKVQEAIAQAAQGAWMYGDPENHDLRHALAQHHGISAENITVGEGIDGLLGYLVRLIIAQGDVVVTSQGAYPTFNYHVTGYGGRLHKVPFAQDHEDPLALAKAAHTHTAKLVYFSNPDNPMGTWHKADVVQDMIERLPKTSLLVLDEAYIDTAPDGTAPPLDVERSNVIRMRTFSKAYGLAGMRVGYAIASAPLIAAFDKVRNHFGVGRIAQAAALAAVQDQSYLTAVTARIANAREKLAQIACINGLTPLPSATNFVTMDCGKDGAFAARVLTALGQQGIFIRMPGVAPLNRCIRVSCGFEQDLKAFAHALPKALALCETAASFTD